MNKFELYKNQKSEIDTDLNCTFIFDTNILIDLYMFEESHTDKIFKILEKIDIWMPYHVFKEFNKNHTPKLYENTGLTEIFKELSKIKKSFSTLNDINIIIEDNKILNNHLDQNKLNQIQEKMDDCNLKENGEKVSEIINNIKSLKPEDLIYKRISELFDDKVGNMTSVKELISIRKEYIFRCEENIPPTCKDLDKEENTFGDLIVWKQIIDYSKKNKKCVVFITGDNDWYLNKEFPFPYLIDEFYLKTGQNIYFLKLEEFISWADDKLDIDVDNDFYEEIKNYNLYKSNENTINEYTRKTKPTIDLITATNLQQELMKSIAGNTGMGTIAKDLAKQQDQMKRLAGNTGMGTIAKDLAKQQNQMKRLAENSTLTNAIKKQNELMKNLNRIIK